MIVRIPEKAGLRNLRNGKAAFGTESAAPMGKLEAAVRANDLVLLFGSYSAAAVTAADEAREGEHMPALRHLL